MISAQTLTGRVLVSPASHRPSFKMIDISGNSSLRVAGCCQGDEAWQPITVAPRKLSWQLGAEVRLPRRRLVCQSTPWKILVIIEQGCWGGAWIGHAPVCPSHTQMGHCEVGISVAYLADTRGEAYRGYWGHAPHLAPKEAQGVRQDGTCAVYQWREMSTALLPHVHLTSCSEFSIKMREGIQSRTVSLWPRLCRTFPFCARVLDDLAVSTWQRASGTEEWWNEMAWVEAPCQGLPQCLGPNLLTPTRRALKVWCSTSIFSVGDVRSHSLRQGDD